MVHAYKESWDIQTVRWNLPALQLRLCEPVMLTLLVLMWAQTSNFHPHPPLAFGCVTLQTSAPTVSGLPLPLDFSGRRTPWTFYPLLRYRASPSTALWGAWRTSSWTQNPWGPPLRGLEYLPAQVALWRKAFISPKEEVMWSWVRNSWQSSRL